VSSGGVAGDKEIASGYSTLEVDGEDHEGSIRHFGARPGRTEIFWER